MVKMMTENKEVNWISIEQKFPPVNQMALVCDYINEFISLGKIEETADGLNLIMMGMDEILDCEVTHWMILPKLPFLEDVIYD